MPVEKSGSDKREACQPRSEPDWRMAGSLTCCGPAARAATSGRGCDKIGNAPRHFAHSCVCLENRCFCERPAPILVYRHRYLPSAGPDSRRRYIQQARK
ncbi:MAG: hypothetical protein DME38_09360 [Verrucomicrobia bacterium]|nr:MAG: hypothetical protein DME38_09360 [Verrucomicrobiota bacterium]